MLKKFFSLKVAMIMVGASILLSGCSGAKDNPSASQTQSPESSVKSSEIKDNPNTNQTQSPTSTTKEGEKKESLFPDTVKIALYEGGYFYNKSSDSGIDKDMAEELGKRAGFKLELYVKDRTAIWAGLENGTEMATTSGIENPSRSVHSRFSNYMSVRNYAIALKSIKEKNPDEFLANKELKWGVIKSFKHGEALDKFLDKLKPEGRVVETGNQMQLFSMLQANRFQVVFAQIPSYAKYLDDLKMKDSVIVEDWFVDQKPISLGMVISKKYFNDKQFEKIDETLKEMNKDGTTEKIFTKYLGEENANKILIK